jgi:hypothetical protein
MLSISPTHKADQFLGSTVKYQVSLNSHLVVEDSNISLVLWQALCRITQFLQCLWLKALCWVHRSCIRSECTASWKCQYASLPQCVVSSRTL